LSELSEATGPVETPIEESEKKVALLYKRNAQPDEAVLHLLEAGLTEAGFKVFIDRHMNIGVEWATEIEWQICSAEAVIPLLSSRSINSEMLEYEVQRAHRAAQEQRGMPRILPVRVDFEGALPDTLAAILDRLNYTVWSGPEDNARLVAALVDSLNNPPAPKPEGLRDTGETVGGAVPLDSEFYIVRDTDEQFRTAIARQTSIVLVKGARQMGKTSLLARGLQQAREQGAKVVFTDFQTLNTSHLQSVEMLYRTLAELIAEQLDLDVWPSEVWNSERGPNINFERYLKREVLGTIKEPLVWGLDEVDRLFTCDFGSEVFGLFRSWHNRRALDPSGPWSRLTLAIAYATEAHLFIRDLNQSPFNVGTRVALGDFTVEEVGELNRRYESPLKGHSELTRFYRLVGGQPYLVRRGLALLSEHGTSLESLEAHADSDDGPFGDHLRRILVSISQDAELAGTVRSVLHGEACPSSDDFYRLRSAGLLAGDNVESVTPRCAIYASYLLRHLNKVGDAAVARINKRQKQIDDLRIEIDRGRMEKQVADVVDSPFFRGLQEKARDLRRTSEE
jgi:hypothetical protein